jgi:hypothetical protein
VVKLRVTLRAGCQKTDVVSQVDRLDAAQPGRVHSGGVELGRSIHASKFYVRWQTWDQSAMAGGEGMTYYEAALQVLRSARHPLTTREITDRALEKGLIKPYGKTPHSTMSAKLHLKARNDQQLVKLQTPGNGRAKRGSVRWTLRKTASKSA